MLYALPPGWVPLLVATGLIVGKLPSYLTGARHPDRIVTAGGNSWHTVGPALVFTMGGLHTPHWSQWPLLFAALLGYFVCDLAATAAREWQ